MKKIIITAIMICTIIATAIPFSSVKAQTAILSSNGGIFDNSHPDVGTIGHFSCIELSSDNANDYLSLEPYGVVNNYDQYTKGHIIQLNFNDYYSGNFDLYVLDDGISLYWIDGNGVASYTFTGALSPYYSISLVNCQSLTIYGFTGNFNANMGTNGFNLYGITKSNDENIVIATSDKIKNVRLTVFGSPNKSATAAVLDNHYIYTDSLPSNYAMNRIDIKFNYSEIVNGNYLVFTFYILSGSQYTSADFGQDLFVRNHSNTLFNISSQCYKDLFISWNSSTGKGVYLITYYVPTAILTSSTYLDQGDWQFSTYTFSIQNAEQVGWIYRGIVETVPDKLNGKADTTDLDTITDDFTDLTDQEHDITEGFNDSLDDFNESINLNDYDFITGLGSAGNYFKIQLENVFNQSVNLRAMWVLPVICIVFLALLGGRP